MVITHCNVLSISKADQEAKHRCWRL